MVKRIATFVLFAVLGLTLWVPLAARSHTPFKETKQQKKADKAGNKYRKQQTKAQKKQIKAQKKEMKKWNKTHQSTTGSRNNLAAGYRPAPAAQSTIEFVTAARLKPETRNLKLLLFAIIFLMTDHRLRPATTCRAPGHH